MTASSDYLAASNTGDRAALVRRLEALYAAEPRLRPNAQMRDYQVTYPPAIVLEQGGFEQMPAREEFLAKLVGPMHNVAYYFHFGFCEYRCRYCFHYEIAINKREADMTRYVDALLAEARASRELTPDLRQVNVFLGGGTPTALTPAAIDRFLRGFGDVVGRPNAKLSTVEAKPVTVTEEKLKAYVDAGWFRCSMGVQTFDPELYAYHHRKEDVAVVRRALEAARRAGFKYINIDLITGLRGETVESWRQTLAATRDLIDEQLIDSVYLYAFHDDPRSPSFTDEKLCPSAEDVMFNDAEARAMFAERGWSELAPRFYRSPALVAAEIEEGKRLADVIPSFGETVSVGFGNSAFTVGDACTYINTRDLNDYCDRVEAGGSPIKYWTALDELQKATRDVTFGVLYAPTVDVKRTREKFGAGSTAAMEAKLRRWADLGLASFDGDAFKLNDFGKLVQLQMIPELYPQNDASAFGGALHRRKLLGKSYRGY
jgi:oxygen-independent coproporphyrinogen III oxidase